MQPQCPYAVWNSESPVVICQKLYQCGDTV